MAYLYLAGAIVFEVAGTMLLPVSQNFTRLLPSVALLAAYGVSFYFLTFAIRDIPIAIVYASWAGLGVFLVALLSLLFHGQTLPWQAVLGLVLIVGGVVLVNSYAEAWGLRKSGKIPRLRSAPRGMTKGTLRSAQNDRGVAALFSPVILREVAESRRRWRNVWGIPRLRFAPRGMTKGTLRSAH